MDQVACDLGVHLDDGDSGCLEGQSLQRVHNIAKRVIAVEFENVIGLGVFVPLASAGAALVARVRASMLAVVPRATHAGHDRAAYRR